MDYLQRLPFILGVTASIITALVSYGQGIDNRLTYTRVAVSLIVFYLLGMIIRGLLMSIYRDVEKKKTEEEQSRNEEVENSGDNSPSGGTKPEGKAIKSKLDLLAGEDEEFLPLAVSHMIKSDLQKKNE